MSSGLYMRLLVNFTRRLALRRPFSSLQTATVSAEINPIHRPPGLTPAQSALAHRIGLQNLNPTSLSAALSHPSIASNSQDKFVGYEKTGRAVLKYFVEEYVRYRFPKLPRDSRQLAHTVYTCSKNLAAVARGVGLEYALVKFRGVPHIHMPVMSPKTSNRVLGETLLALLGLIAKNDLPSARQFIDTFVFTTVFDTKCLVKPRYPIVQLAQALQAQGHPSAQPVFRLLHESGRTSNSSMYVVGVYAGESDQQMLGEGYGPSMNLAEHRAAVEALRAMYLVDVHDASRPSDALLSPTSGTITKLTLEMILKSAK